MTYIKTYLPYILVALLIASIGLYQYQLFTMKRADRAMVEIIVAQQKSILFLGQSLYVANILIPTDDNKDLRINPMLIPPQ